MADKKHGLGSGPSQAFSQIVLNAQLKDNAEQMRKKDHCPANIEGQHWFRKVNGQWKCHNEGCEHVRGTDVLSQD